MKKEALYARPFGAGQLLAILLASLTLSMSPFLSEPASASPEGGESIIKERCAECHAFVKPESSSRKRLVSRKGQDLFYAGSKYNRKWLVKWLQNPIKIRPKAKYGSFKAAGKEKSGTKTAGHIILTGKEAVSAADYMMTLKAPEDVVIPGLYREGAYPPEDGRFAYVRANGCAGCHMWAPGKGGRGGPELYTGGERMNPDYIASFIKNPQKFDAGNWMPRQFFSDSNIQRLTSFILGLNANAEGN